ncbi:putative 2-dehydropantoate 2-reductase-like protein [Zalerion maritima]|uniref:2-dehydropantoate 2-reductase-like protein n=1 Tax=Zalerion maritima TaxID=339359 RepID=A0AAD5RRT4_9PEZI|nr:putative 2-dehydropantoate 2-reductase-like protein [Zalerion maritima]
MVHRVVSHSDKPGRPPLPSQVELERFLESLQSVTFAQYNEVRTQRPIEGKQDSALEDGKRRKAMTVMAKNVWQDVPQDSPQESTSIQSNVPLTQPSTPHHEPTELSLLADSAKQALNIMDMRDNGAAEHVSTRSLKATHWARMHSLPANSTPRHSAGSVPRIPLFEPRTAPSTQQRPSRNDDFSMGMTSEQIEDLYLKSINQIRHLETAAGDTILILHQLHRGHRLHSPYDPDLPSLDAPTDGKERPQSRLYDPPHPPSGKGDPGFESLYDDLSPPDIPMDSFEKDTIKLPAMEPIPDWVPRMDPRTLSTQQYYLLGFDVRSKYLAHRLSGALYRPPVQILVRDPQVIQAWDILGKKMRLHRDRNIYVHTRIFPQLVRSFRPGQIVRWNNENEDMIENLFITAPGRSVIPELRPIFHRINTNTTIVLVQDGLGIPEALNARFFPDPANRPKYIEGHLSALLYSLKDDPFAVKEMVQGPLYLSTRMKDQDVLVRKFPDRDLYGPTRLLQSLTTVPGLNMVPSARAMFLFHKLPLMMVQSIVEPLSVLVDGRYSQIPRGYPNNRLIERLLMEMCAVVTSLPEFATFPEAQRYFNYDHGKIRDRVVAMITKRAKTSDSSQMWRLIEAGKITDIMFLNGYFSLRAEEMGLRVPLNDAVINLVKAKHEAKVKDLKDEIQWDGWAKSLT